MRRLREIGLNTVYIECWKNGRPQFESDSFRKAIGAQGKADANEAAPRDVFAQAVIEAHRNGLLCIGWFRDGFMIAASDDENALLLAKKEWITTTIDGKPTAARNAAAWLNPFHPEVQEYLIGTSIDALRKYDLDGIALDDHIGLPADLGYDPYTKSLYKSETGREVPADSNDADWMKWRADKITDFALRLVAELRMERPELILSIAPEAHPSSYQSHLCDWLQWTRWCYCGGKRWTEYVPQCDGTDGPATIKNIQAQIELVGEEKVNLVPRIGVADDGPDLKMDGVKSVIEFTREQGLAGHVLTSSGTVLDRYSDELKAFYDAAAKGPAANPFRSADWRPMPVVPTRNGNAWKATITQAGRYRIIARQNGNWSETVTLDLAPGDHTMVQDGEAVELLVDRRP